MSNDENGPRNLPEQRVAAPGTFQGIPVELSSEAPTDRIILHPIMLEKLFTATNSAFSPRPNEDPKG